MHEKQKNNLLHISETHVYVCFIESCGRGDGDVSRDAHVGRSY